MLKVNVGLSRKLSRDYNSTGFSVNFEGEITAPINDNEAVIEQVKEIFDLAEEALDQQVQRATSIDAQATRDEGHRPTRPAIEQRYRQNGQDYNGHGNNGNGARSQNHSSHDDSQGESATNKQLQYLQSLGKRNRLSTAQLEEQIQEILHRQVGLYDLSKQQAAKVIDALTTSPANGRTNGRY